MAQPLNGARTWPVEVAAIPAGKSGDRSAARTLTLVVENMNCGSCLGKIERTLRDVPGVATVRGNLSARRVTVAVAAPAIDGERLIDVLKSAGFNAAQIVASQTSATQSDELDFLSRIGVAGFAAANIMLLSVSVWSGAGGDMGPTIQALFHLLSASIALPAIAYAGQPFFRSAWQALSHRRLNMDVPISLGVILATAMSLFQTLRGSEQVYFDAAVALLLFLLVGRFLDLRMRSRAMGTAANLLALRANSATVIGTDGLPMRLLAHDLVPGMRILVAAGERIAVDGRVVQGAGEVDNSLVSGESTPQRVGIGATVYAGTLNLATPITIVATATDEGTLIAEIARLMSAAEQARGRYVRLADRAARLYAPAVHVLGLTTFIGWMVLGHGWEAALTAAIAVLIITCPCALALAVPAVQVAATARLFRRGVLVKAPDGLERLAEADTVVLDKTGTLSLGEPQLLPLEQSDHVLSQAAALASSSRHPYARAVVRAALDQHVEFASASDVVETPGVGLSRKTPLGEERLGSALWCGVSGEPGEKAALWYRAPGKPPIALQFEDRLRADAKDVVTTLHRAGYAVELLSGDRPQAVACAAKDAGISTWRARQMPADKIARLKALSEQGRKVVMVGDGLNDAPALAAAHASMSPSTAADISQTAADVVFQGEKLGAIVEALAVAKAARRLALQNFGLAVGYNAVFVPLAMGGWVTPLVAALAMSTSSILVTVNALRLGRMRLKDGCP
jgi:Cu2+-exporting ATPase